MANQFTKDKKTIAFIESRENSPSRLQRRVYLEITIRNNLHSSTGALRKLIRDECPLETRTIRLKWLLGHLNKFSEDKLDDDDLSFLEEYIVRYSGIYKPRKEKIDIIREENKANELILRLPFGSNKVFGKYEYSRQGRKRELLKWPNDAYKWPAQGRIEFILYCLQMENIPPERLNEIADFNAATGESILDKGFTAHYSRKPVTVGCQNAANIRLNKGNGTRGIDVKTEMKSMLYLAFTGIRYCLIGVHVNGNLDVDENKVKHYFLEFYNIPDNIKQVQLIRHDNLLNYLEKIVSPIPFKLPEEFKQVTKYGAQELISLFASSINPVSIFMAARFKYEYIKSLNLNLGFDCLMLWDELIFEFTEMYNNAGSPTWGMRFSPNEMYNHLYKNTITMEDQYSQVGFKIKYKMTKGNYSMQKI